MNDEDALRKSYWRDPLAALALADLLEEQGCEPATCENLRQFSRFVLAVAPPLARLACGVPLRSSQLELPGGWLLRLGRGVSRLLADARRLQPDEGGPLLRFHLVREPFAALIPPLRALDWRAPTYAQSQYVRRRLADMNNLMNHPFRERTTP